VNLFPTASGDSDHAAVGAAANASGAKPLVPQRAAGYITRQRNGRRNHYTINAHLPLPDAIAREQNIGELLKILTVTHTSPRPADRTATIT
jgi:hypothetical protein